MILTILADWALWLHQWGWFSPPWLACNFFTQTLLTLNFVWIFSDMWKLSPSNSLHFGVLSATQINLAMLVGWPPGLHLVLSHSELVDLRCSTKWSLFLMKLGMLLLHTQYPHLVLKLGIIDLQNLVKGRPQSGHHLIFRLELLWLQFASNCF